VTHALTLTLGGPEDLAWAQATVTEHHYLHAPVDPRARPMCYVIRRAYPYYPVTPRNYDPIGLIILGIPHATRCGGWWGYEGLPTQWQVVDLSRIWIHPGYQRGRFGMEAQPGIVPGYTDRRGIFRPTVATWAISEVLARVQADRVRLWPPVYPDQPYHIRLAISYSDPKFHRGTIYRHAGAQPMYTDRSGAAVPGPSGKYGWAWRLPQPAWEWQQLTDIRPRTMRMY